MENTLFDVYSDEQIERLYWCDNKVYYRGKWNKLTVLNRELYGPAGEDSIYNVMNFNTFNDAYDYLKGTRRRDIFFLGMSFKERFALRFKNMPLIKNELEKHPECYL